MVARPLELARGPSLELLKCQFNRKSEGITFRHWKNQLLCLCFNELCWMECFGSQGPTQEALTLEYYEREIERARAQFESQLFTVQY